MALTKLNLEYQADKFLHDSTPENEKTLMDEVVRVILEDGDIIIDGEVLPDGQIDPAHMEVEIDHRFYFHVYTSRLRFDECNAKKPYVLKLKALLDPIYAEDTFGGISLNYKKGQSVVLISKENIYDSLNAYLGNGKAESEAE